MPIVLRILAVILIPLATTSFSSFALASERIALVIGNQSYADAPLFNPVNDATAIGGELTAMGYATTVVKDASRQAIEVALDDFSLAAKDADIALFFYAGHAIQVDGQNYIIPVNARVQNRRDIRKLIALEEVTTELGRAQSLGVAIIDACRDNPFSNSLNAQLGRSVAGRGLARVKISAGKLLVAYATEADTIAADGSGKHSPYTAALLKHIGDPETDVRLMFGRVHDDVVTATKGRQSPNIYGSLGGRRYVLNAGGFRPVSAIDIEQINNQFTALAKSIKTKDRKRIKNLAQPSKQWDRYLDYVMENFEDIDLQLSPAEIENTANGMAVVSTLTIKELRSANGDISYPSAQLKSVKISSKRTENAWSQINW